MKKHASSAIDSLVENNQSLVYHIAMKIHRRLPVRHDLDDLIGYGMIGLVEAAQKFRPGRGNEFATFAWPRINGAIYDGVSKLSWMSRSRYRRLVKVKEKAEADGDTLVADQATEDLVGISPLAPDAAQSLVETEESTVATRVARLEEGEILGRLIEELPIRERRLITMVYIEGLSLKEASERLGVSKGWGSRMHSKVLTGLAMSMKATDSRIDG